MIKNFFKSDRPLAIKKIISIALILFGMLFVLLNKDVYYSTHVDSVRLKAEVPEEETLIEFSGNRTYEQQFNGWRGELKKVTIRFFNQGKEESAGSVTVNILNSDGTVIQSAEKPLTEVINSVKTTFAFKEPCTLSDQENYTLQVITHDAKNPQSFGIYTHVNKGDLFGSLTENGNPIEGRLRATFIYRFYNTTAIMDMFILLILALCFVLIPFGKIDLLIEKKFHQKLDTGIWISRLFFLATPFLCILLGDRFNGYHLSEMLDRIFTRPAVFNLIIYVMIWLTAYLIINRTQYASMVVLGIVFIADMANYYVWVFRGCPILAADLQSLTTAVNVANNFSYTLDLTGVWGVVYIISFIAMLLSLKGYRGVRKKQRLVVAVSTVGCIFLFYALFFQSDYVAKRVEQHMWNPQGTYAKNGNALSFVLSWSSTRVEKPKNYSLEAVQKNCKRLFL